MVRAVGAAKIAQKNGQLREGLYRMFSGGANPALDTAITVLQALDLQLNITVSAVPSKMPGVRPPRSMKRITKRRE
jgi:DNA-binding phage protein